MEDQLQWRMKLNLDTKYDLLMFYDSFLFIGRFFILPGV